MNAIPQKAYHYRQAGIPGAPARQRPANNIESLDARRAQKLAAKREREERERRQREYLHRRQREEIEMEKIDMLYNRPRAQAGPREEPPRKKWFEKKPQQKPALTREQMERKQIDMLYNRPRAQAQPRERAYEAPRRPGYQPAMAYGTRQFPRMKKREPADYRYSINADGSISARDGIAGFDMNVGGAAMRAYGKQVAADYAEPKRKGVSSTIITIALVFLMLAAVLNMYATQSDITYRNAQLEKSIAQKREELDKINMAIALEDDLGSIQEKARALDMDYPLDGQIVYLPAENEVIPVESGAVTAEGEGVSEGEKAAAPGNILDKILDFFAGGVEKLMGLFSGEEGV